MKKGFDEERYHRNERRNESDPNAKANPDATSYRTVEPGSDNGSMKK
jgi:hypothetical protein